MQSCGISPEGNLTSSHQESKTDEPLNGMSKFSGSPTSKQQKEEPCAIEMPSNKGTTFIPSTEELPITLKRQKVCEVQEESHILAKATESSLVEWLKNNNDGVCLIDSELSVFSCTNMSAQFIVTWFK